jgi:cytochrome c
MKSLDRPLPSCLAGIALAVAGLAPAAAAEDLTMLAMTANCLNCHAIDVASEDGPSFQAIARRYQGDKAAADRLAQKILKGGSGVWGSKKMDPNEVSPEDAKRLAEWILRTP